MGEIKQAYIEELEQRLSDLWHEITELEIRIKKANMETGAPMYVQIQELRNKHEQTRVELQNLREHQESEWLHLKEELEKAWVGLRGALDKMAEGFSREWDERD